MSKYEESMVMANFLRKHTPHIKNNAKMLLAEPINDDTVC